MLWYLSAFFRPVMFAGTVWWLLPCRKTYILGDLLEQKNGQHAGPLSPDPPHWETDQDGLLPWDPWLPDGSGNGVPSLTLSMENHIGLALSLDHKSLLLSKWPHLHDAFQDCSNRSLPLLPKFRCRNNSTIPSPGLWHRTLWPPKPPSHLWQWSLHWISWNAPNVNASVLS